MAVSRLSVFDQFRASALASRESYTRSNCFAMNSASGYHPPADQYTFQQADVRRVGVVNP